LSQIRNRPKLGALTLPIETLLYYTGGSNSPSLGGYNHWTGLLDYWTGLLDYWTGLLDWTTGLDYWTLLDWTTGLLDLTTGLTQTAKYNSFSAEPKLNFRISSVTLLILLFPGLGSRLSWSF